MSDDDRTPVDADDPPVDAAEPREGGIVRHEEELNVDKEAYHAGSVRARKFVETRRVEEVFPRDVEHADTERIAPNEHDSGQVETLPDGSVSVPIFEVELVVTKRIVVRERVIIHKRTITEHHRIEADLRRERLEVESDPAVESVVERES